MLWKGTWVDAECWLRARGWGGWVGGGGTETHSRRMAGCVLTVCLWPVQLLLSLPRRRKKRRV